MGLVTNSAIEGSPIASTHPRSSRRFPLPPIWQHGGGHPWLLLDRSLSPRAAITSSRRQAPTTSSIITRARCGDLAGHGGARCGHGRARFGHGGAQPSGAGKLMRTPSSLLRPPTVRLVPGVPCSGSMATTTTSPHPAASCSPACLAHGRAPGLLLRTPARIAATPQGSSCSGR